MTIKVTETKNVETYPFCYLSFSSFGDLNEIKYNLGGIFYRKSSLKLVILFVITIPTILYYIMVKVGRTLENRYLC